MDDVTDDAADISEKKNARDPDLHNVLVLGGFFALLAMTPALLLYLGEHAPYWRPGAITPDGAFALQFYMGVFWLLAILCLLLSLVILLIMAVILLFKREKRTLRYVFAGVLLVFLGSLVSALSPFLVRTDFVKTFTPVAERGQAIIDAVEAYHMDKGTYPGCVDDFVPVYLKQLPSTGLAGYPEFEYTQGDNTIPYAITVNTPRGVLNWDQFIYWPTGEYDKQYWGGWIEPIGKWVYFHE